MMKVGDIIVSRNGTKHYCAGGLDCIGRLATFCGHTVHQTSAVGVGMCGACVQVEAVFRAYIGEEVVRGIVRGS
jgi:hypothetical protein